MNNKLQAFLLLNYISLASISAAIITPALPQIMQHFHLPTGMSAWIVSIFLIGYVAGQLIYGPLSNRFGRIIALRIGLFINLIGILICLFASTLTQSYELLLAGRLITALGASAGLVCSFTLINELFAPHIAKKVLSYAVLSFTLGLAIAVALGGYLTQYFHWQTCFIALFIQGIILFIGNFSLCETLKEKDKNALNYKSILQGYAQALTSKRLIAFAIILSCCTTMSYTYSACGPLVAQLQLNLSPASYGTWNLVTTFGMLIGGIISVQLTQKMNGLFIIKLSLSLMMTCLGFLILFKLFGCSCTICFFTLMAIMFCTNSLLFPCASFYAVNAIDNRASASAMMNFLNMGVATLAVSSISVLPFQALTDFILLTGIIALISFLLSFCFES